MTKEAKKNVNNRSKRGFILNFIKTLSYPLSILDTRCDSKTCAHVFQNIIHRNERNYFVKSTYNESGRDIHFIVLATSCHIMEELRISGFDLKKEIFRRK